jgi:hypothetical protein
MYQFNDLFLRVTISMRTRQSEQAVEQPAIYYFFGVLFIPHIHIFKILKKN